MSLMLDKVTRVVGGQTHIAPINLELESGSLSLLLGLTLAGKTSLLRLMAGLDKPTSGRVIVNDEDVTARPVRKRNVAMVYQQFINYPSMTVYDNIAALSRNAWPVIPTRALCAASRLRSRQQCPRLVAATLRKQIARNRWPRTNTKRGSATVFHMGVNSRLFAGLLPESRVPNPVCCRTMRPSA